MTRDLDRWSGNTNAPEELQELLRSARTDVPNAQQLSGLEGKLAGLLDAPVPPAAAPAPDAPGSFGMPGLAKLAALVAIGGLVGTGIYLGTRSSDEAKPPSPTQTALAPVSQPLPAERASAAPPSGVEADAPQAEPSANADATSEANPHAAKAPTTKPSEASLLNQAQQALKTDPRRALALTRRHKQVYPQGSLSQEREVIAIEALSRLDKTSTAHERAEEFNEKYPESAHHKKVDTSLKK